jgi:small subunit ribosomal protein S6
METTAPTLIRSYEAMFIFTNSAVNTDWDAQEQKLLEAFQRTGCEVLRRLKWDERALAYPIRRQKRGSFFLVYFQGPPAAVAEITNETNLNEKVLRLMVVERKGKAFFDMINMSDDDIRKHTCLPDRAAEASEKARADARAEAERSVGDRRSDD